MPSVITTLDRRTVLKHAATATALGIGLTATSGQAAAMNKGELIDSIAADADLTKADAKRALDAFMENTQNSLARGEPVTLGGFGRFFVTAANEDRNSNREGQRRHRDQDDRGDENARKVVKFKPGKDLSEAVK